MAVVGEATIKLNYDGKSAKVQAEKIAGEQTSILSKIGAGAKSVGKGIAAGIGAGLLVTKSAIELAATAAVKQYTKFEQLQGGIETLYGKSADTMMANAENAYKTAGMSANKYMETATSFAASLVQSLGGDTAKAASYADRAIQDMSDNANKMGTDIESIQNAYQGFAKQNYTMLDNLKLGYGGTKSEMERLLADAEKLSGKKFDISSYADITEAIHIVQQEMGITGTTAKEAGTTIEGSLNSAKAAWQNLIGDLAKPSADIGKSVDNLVTSLFGDGTDKNLGLFGNALPAVERAITGIAKALPNLVKKLAAKLPKLLKEIIPPLMEATVQVFVAIADSLPALMPLIVDGLVDLVVALVPHIPTILGALLAAIVQLVVALLASIGDLLAPWLASIAEGLWKWFDGIFQSIGSALADFSQSVLDAVSSFVNGFRNGIEAVKNFFMSIPSFIAGIFAKIGDLFRGIGTKIGEIVSGAFKAVVNGILNFIEGFLNTPIDAINGLIGTINIIPGVDIPTLGRINLPRLAKGGLVTGSTLANIGERGNEAVIPLEQNTENWARPLAQAIAEQFKAQNLAGAGITVYMTNNINNNLDADEIGQRLMTSIRRAA